MELAFRIGKVPVRVLPSFLVVTALLGYMDSDLRKLVAWVLIVGVSVMAHELGHALAGMAFGLEPQIELHGMGGTTSWVRAKGLSNGRRIAISLAGPAAGFAVGALVLVTAWAASRAGVSISPGGIAQFAVNRLLFVNFGWGVLNLLPILPLDGGHVAARLLDALTGGRGERWARLTSIVLAAAATVLALIAQWWWPSAQWWWPALLSGSFLVSNWRSYRELSAYEHDVPMRSALEQAYAALDAKDAPRIVALARPIALGSRTDSMRAEALQLLAFGFLLEGRVPDADAAIAAMPHGFAPHPSLVALREETAGDRPAR
jgi:Zn-dependent protease